MGDLLIGFFAAAAAIGVAIWAINKSQENKDRAYRETTTSSSNYRNALQSGDPAAFVRAADAYLDATHAWEPRELEDTVGRVYRDTLSLLRQHPDLKPFALRLGRRHYSGKRPNRTPTIYDEQAVQNDIQAHS